MQRTAMALAGLVLACWGTALLHGQVQLSAQQDDDLPHGGGTIRGYVTAAATGAPIPGAAVRALITSLDASPVTTVTDGDGAFELRGLTPGRWRVDAAKSGFLARSFGQRGTSARVGTLTLKDRAVVTASIALVRAGVIAGRVFDAFGEPAVGVPVQVMRLLVAGDWRPVMAAGVPDLTDDRGAFRVYGLSPGDYFVTARQQPPARYVTIGGERVERRLFNGAPGVSPPPGIDNLTLPTYFPGTREIRSAERVMLGAGEERAGVDFSLTSGAPARVSGRVLDSSGEPPARPALISLFSDVHDPTLLFMMSRRIENGGTFEFPVVPPGSYTITVGGAGSGPTEFAHAPLTVGSEDITGLTIVTAPGVPLTGTIVSSGSPLPDLRGAAVVAISTTGQGRALAPVGDERFQFQDLLGDFRLDMQGLPAKWLVESIAINGADVTDTPVAIRSGPLQATITLTNQLTNLSGVVTNNRQPSDAEIAIFVDDPAKWTSRRFVHEVRADEQGMFSVSGLPPHARYLAVAIDNIEPGDLENTEFLERLRSRAVSFSLEEGQSRRLPLTLIERSAIDGR